MMPYDNREVVLRLAVADIGLALGDAVWAEVNPALRGKAWCGAWVLSKLRQAGLTNATWTMGSGFVAKLRLPLTTNLNRRISPIGTSRANTSRWSSRSTRSSRSMATRQEESSVAKLT